MRSPTGLASWPALRAPKNTKNTRKIAPMTSSGFGGPPVNALNRPLTTDTTSHTKIEKNAKAMNAKVAIRVMNRARIAGQSVGGKGSFRGHHSGFGSPGVQRPH